MSVLPGHVLAESKRVVKRVKDVRKRHRRTDRQTDRWISVLPGHVLVGPRIVKRVKEVR